MIKHDVQEALIDATVFSGFAQVTEDNSDWIAKHNGWHFGRSFARCYAHRMALAVRRQLKEDPHAISLARLLSQVELCAPQITFGKYMNFFPHEAGGPPWQAVTFRSVCPPGQLRVTDDVTVSREVVAADRARLRQAAKDIEDFADRVIAHTDPRGFAGQVTFGDLRSAVSEFDKVAVKYVVFLTGDGYDTLEPVVQFNWQEVFDHPLREKPRKHPVK